MFAERGFAQHRLRGLIAEVYGRPDMRVLSNPIRINGERLAQMPCSAYGADTRAYVGEICAPERAGSR